MFHNNHKSHHTYILSISRLCRILFRTCMDQTPDQPTSVKTIQSKWRADISGETTTLGRWYWGSTSLFSLPCQSFRNYQLLSGTTKNRLIYRKIRYYNRIDRVKWLNLGTVKWVILHFSCITSVKAVHSTIIILPHLSSSWVLLDE